MKFGLSFFLPLLKLIKACSELWNVSTAAGLSCLPQQLASKRLCLPEPLLPLLQVMLCRYKTLCTEKLCAQEHRCTFIILWKFEPENFLDNFYHFCDSLNWWVTVSPFFLIFIYYFLCDLFLHLFSSLKHKARAAALSTTCMWSPWRMSFTNIILLMGLVQVLLLLKDLSCWLPSVPWLLTHVSIDGSVCEYRLNFHKCRSKGINLTISSFFFC